MRLDNKTFYHEANLKYLVAIIDKNKSELGYIHEKIKDKLRYGNFFDHEVQNKLHSLSYVWNMGYQPTGEKTKGVSGTVSVV